MTKFKPTIRVFIWTIALVLLAEVGWIIFIAGFGVLNTKEKFFEQLDKISTLPPDQATKTRELLFLPYNSHYIVASLSPLLFILMMLQSALIMVCEAEKRFLVSILSIPIYILVGFVLISSGVVLYSYSSEFVLVRLGEIAPSYTPPLQIYNAIFAGVLIETIFLILALIKMHASTVVGAMQQKDNHQGYVELRNSYSRPEYIL